MQQSSHCQTSEGFSPVPQKAVSFLDRNAPTAQPMFLPISPNCKYSPSLSTSPSAYRVPYDGRNRANVVSRDLFSPSSLVPVAHGIVCRLYSAPCFDWDSGGETHNHQGSSWGSVSDSVHTLRPLPQAYSSPDAQSCLSESTE